MRTFRILISLFICLNSLTLFAQEDGNLWETLMSVEWEYKYSEAFDEDIPFPIFNEKILALDGKEVVIKGYLLPVETEDGSLVFSAFPFANCFFCGGAGPESVMSIYPESEDKYDMDEIAFKGILELNNTDTGLIYILKEAKEYYGDL